MFGAMTLRKKIAALMTAAVLVTAAAAGWTVYRAERGRLIEENGEMLSRYLGVFAEAAEKDGIKGVAEAFSFWHRAYPDGRITIINTMGEVLLDNKASLFELDNHYKRPEVMEAFANGEASELRYSKTNGEWLNYMAKRVIIPGGAADAGLGLVIRLAYPVDRLSGLAMSLAKPFLYSLEIMLLFVWVGAYLMLRAIMRPLASLSRAAETIAAGGGARFPLTNDIEIQSLSNALNSMSDSLKLSVNEARERKEEMSQLVGALPIGLILIDDEKKVRYMNLAASRLCGWGDQIPQRGASVEIVLPSEAMSSTLDAPDGKRLVTLARNGGVKIEITTLTITRGRLIVMQDMSEKMKLDEARRDFFIDAGHEFQTPLSVIRTGLELLKSGGTLADAEDVKTVDGMIKQQERISGLVDDLLFLVRLDVDPLVKNDESVDLRELGEELLSDVKNLPNAGGVSISSSLPPTGAFVRGSYGDLRRAVFNLLENGVKYVSSVKKSGGSVAFSIKDSGVCWEILVEDDGPGVPEAERDAIFERFRRGDQHRARGAKTGGYGLGLSISRRIAERHGGKLAATDSALGGAAFLMTLPKE